MSLYSYSTLMDVSSNFFVLEINCTSQQTFVLVKAYLRRLQCNTLLSSKTSWRPLENILENVFKTSWKTSWRRLENTLKTSCKHVFKTSSRSLEGVFGRCIASTYWRRIKNVCEDGKSLRWRRLENVFKTSWRFLENLFVRRLEDVLKTFWRRLENVFKTSWRRMTKTNILVLIKTSSEEVWVRRIYSSWWRRLQKKMKDVFKTPSSRQMFAGFKIFTDCHKKKHADLSNGGLFWKSLGPLFGRTYENLWT